jgi:cellulose synthase (UDP-forming)
VIASVVGVVRLYLGESSAFSVAVNLFWVLFDLAILGVVIKAVRYRGPETEGTT